MAIFDPRSMVDRIYKEDHYIYCYIQNMKALGLVLSEEKIVYVFSHDATPGRGLYGPKGHGGQDL